jgi:hypothetical protein
MTAHVSHFGVPSSDDVPTCAHLAQPDVDESDLVDEGAQEALTVLGRFLDLVSMGMTDDALHMLHPDCVISTIVSTVEGEAAIRALLIDWSMKTHLASNFAPWKFVNHDLDTDHVSPVKPRSQTRRPPATSSSAAAIYNALRKQQKAKDADEEVSTRFVLERTGKQSRSFKPTDFRKLHMRESVVVVDGLIRLYTQQILED